MSGKNDELDAVGAISSAAIECTTVILEYIGHVPANRAADLRRDLVKLITRHVGYASNGCIADAEGELAAKSPRQDAAGKAAKH